LVPSKFKNAQNPWDDINFRRKAFERIAKQHGFDPFDPKNWDKTVIKRAVASLRKSMKGNGGDGLKMILTYHSLRIATALVELFPEMLAERKTKTFNPDTTFEHKKRIFERFAKRNGFDPLDAHSWAAQTNQKLVALTGWNYVKNQYNGNVVQMLSHFFPNIGLVPSMFRASWKTAEQRRAYFEKYARDHNFNPLDAESWYQHRPNFASKLKYGPKKMVTLTTCWLTIEEV